jgi:hypothetical protein
MERGLSLLKTLLLMGSRYLGMLVFADCPCSRERPVVHDVLLGLILVFRWEQSPRSRIAPTVKRKGNILFGRFEIPSLERCNQERSIVYALPDDNRPLRFYYEDGTKVMKEKTRSRSSIEQMNYFCSLVSIRESSHIAV